MEATHQGVFTRFYPKVSTRITVPFLLMILVVAAIGVLIVTRLVAGNIQERLANQLADSAQAAANTIVDIENQHLAALRAMVFTEGVADSILQQDTAALERLILGVIVNEAVDDVIVFNTQGEVIYRALDGVSVGLVSVRDAATWTSTQKILSGQVDPLGDKFVDIRSLDGEAHFYFAAPVVTLQNTLAGGMFVGISSSSFIQQVSQQTLSAVTLHNTQGEVLGTSFRDAVNSQLAIPLEEFGQILSTVQNESPISREIVIENVAYQFLYAPFQLRSSQVGLIAVALPVDFVQDRIGTSRNIFFGLFAFVMLTVAMLGVVISRSIVSPVSRIVDTTRAIRSGDLSRRVQLQTPDELGELGQSVDHMTNQLVLQNHEIRVLYNAQVEETARRDSVLQSIGDGVLVLDDKGQPFFYNSTAETIMSSIYNDPNYYTAYGRLLTHPHDFYEPQGMSFGEEYFSVLSTPVLLSSGKTLGHVLVFRNITQIIQSEKLKDEIILQLSHELRTPLSAAKGYADLLMMFADKKLDDQEHTFGQNVVDQLDILAGFIDQVIEVNEMLVNKLQIDIETFDLSRSLKELIEECRPKIERGQLRITSNLPNHEVVIEADKLRIEQVIRNILKNAYSYTLPGGRIGVELEYDGSQHLVITINDTGVGIGSDEIHRVFDKMYRGHAADAGPTDTRGMGLGLYISRQIVEAHQGTITIESEENVGTIVILRLPKRQTL